LSNNPPRLSSTRWIGQFFFRRAGISLANSLPVEWIARLRDWLIVPVNQQWSQQQGRAGASHRLIPSNA
jgi:hypothetical protein